MSLSKYNKSVYCNLQLKNKEQLVNRKHEISKRYLQI